MLLDAVDYFAQTKPKYRQNQFGGTIGGPIVKNHLFFFGDVEANRIIFGETDTYTVPTALMRQGNFSELLNPGLTGQSQPTVLYQPGSKGSALLACNGQQNVFCPNQINSIAQGLLNLYPLPNANGGKTYNNYVFNRNNLDNTVQWDGRIDWNASAHDQAFFRMSYYNERGNYAPPLGPILDGGSYGVRRIDHQHGRELCAERDARVHRHPGERVPLRLQLGSLPVPAAGRSSRISRPPWA